MTVRVYLMPVVVGQYARFAQFRLPKYLATADAIERRNCTMLRYGQEDVCLFILDATDDQHTAIFANADVRAFPADLDTAITNGARTQIVNALEALNVPAHWVANGQTFRVVLRRLAGIFDLFCNLEGRALRFLQSSLDSQISTLPAGVRNGMQEAAATLGLSTAGITGATTLRAALAAIGAQFDARPVKACGTDL